MEPEVIDFGLILSQDKPQVTGQPIEGNFDTTFANWLVVARCLSPYEGKITAYRIRAVSKGELPRNRDDATRLGMEVMLNKDWANSTKYGYLYAIERWMAHIGQPVKFAKKPRATNRCPTYLDQEQLNKLIRAAKDYWEFAILSTFIYTGARLNEVRMLDMGDVDFNQKLIRIRHAKRDKERSVPLNGPLEQILRAYMARLNPAYVGSETPLFGTKGKGTRLNRRYIAKIVEKVAERAGLPGVHPHVLRHSFATAWVENGGDVFTLKEVLGHSNIKTTERYWHLNTKAKKEAFGRAAPKL